MILFENKTKKYFVFTTILIIALLMLNYLGKLVFFQENPDIIEDVDSQYSRIWVKKIEGNDVSYKTLQVDTGLEFDEKMTELAKNQFNLEVENPKLKIHHQDGRSFLNTNQKKYDAILIDAFKGMNAPFELTTYEAMQKVKNSLKDGGCVITNIISAIEGKESDFIKYEYATYQAVFDEVKVFQVNPNHSKEEKQNLILLGIKGNDNYAEEKKEEYKELLETQITDFSSNKKIVTDNYAPVGN